MRRPHRYFLWIYSQQVSPSNSLWVRVWGGGESIVSGVEKPASPACTPEGFQPTREESPEIFPNGIIMMKETAATSIKKFIHNLETHSHAKVGAICVCPCWLQGKIWIYWKSLSLTKTLKKFLESEVPFQSWIHLSYLDFRILLIRFLFPHNYKIKWYFYFKILHCGYKYDDIMCSVALFSEGCFEPILTDLLLFSWFANHVR